MGERDDAARQLARALTDLQACEERITTSVMRLRHAGVSWDTIANYMGLTKQAVWARYKDLD